MRVPHSTRCPSTVGHQAGAPGAGVEVVAGVAGVWSGAGGDARPVDNPVDTARSADKRVTAASVKEKRFRSLPTKDLFKAL
ncbi:hypothetical protein Ssi02_56810 [Sinosporangium siamense]|uniref:Uncharacterized protein n=1 Tax=Sinosporangium siamense TaxID=1367973 RepID=A0A919RMA3_9ACTN|nr:hypothetical protein Ssi02_56810 [Sinosporangium siamense]